jgi:hypothetical protein
MKKIRLMFLALALVLAGTSSAYARDSFGFSINLGSPGFYGPPPVYYAPPPAVYYQPAPVYYHYYAPQAYYGPRAYYRSYEPRYRGHDRGYDRGSHRGWDGPGRGHR